MRERDLARDDGLFIVEGLIALERLVLGARLEPHAVFIAQARLPRLTALLAQLPPSVPVYVAAQGVLDEVAGFPLHRGVLALARRGEPINAGELLSGLTSGPQRTVLCLVGLANHDNVGACFRHAAAFGVDAVLLDAESCDPHYRKAIRVSSGWTLSLPFARATSGAAMLEMLAAQGFGEVWALSPAGGDPLWHMARPPRLALMLGAEGPGLPADLLARARRVTIPMQPGVDSLNVATAGAIALAHAFAQPRDGLPETAEG